MKVRLATLRTCMGKDCAQIYRNLPLTEEEKGDLKLSLEKLEEYFKPQVNTVYERYIFNTCKQGGQTADEYVNLLRKYASTCNYGGMKDELIRDRIVLGVNDEKIRLPMFQEQDLALVKAINMIRADETNQKQLKEIAEAETFNFNKNQGRHQQSKITISYYKAVCGYCQTEHKPARESCPAFGQTCHNCGKKNHFAIVCRARKNVMRDTPQMEKIIARRSKTVHQILETSDPEEEYAYQVTHDVGSIRTNGKQLFVNMKMQSYSPLYRNIKVISCQLDTGSTCNLMSIDEFKRLTQSSCKLLTSNAKLKLYNGFQINPIGQALITCEYMDRKEILEFQIVEKGTKPLLSAETCLKFDLIKVQVPTVRNFGRATHEILHSQETISEKVVTTESIIASFSDVFEGLGCFEGVCHLEVDPSVTPVKHTPRRVPVALRKEFQEMLNTLEDQGVVAKVTEPTDWISSSLLVRRGNKLRLCIDPKDLNKALKRAHYPMPTLDEILPELQEAKVFSVVDASNGFWHVKLDEESSYLTTFWTPFGRYRWLRMPFGISPAPEEYQRRQEIALEGLQGICPVFDDILIIGRGDTLEMAEADHDRNFISLLERAREKNLKLNLKKLKLKLPQVVFVGHLLTSEGLLPDPEKVRAVKEMTRPDGKTYADKIKAMQRFLGFINYLSKFLPNLAEESEPLRRLTDKEAEWIWDDIHEQAFQNLKQLVISHPLLAYYDVSKPSVIQCDSSSIGLGAALLQEGRPIAYASRTLTATERNYAPIEKECLAIVFACDRFEQYIYGKHVNVDSDHKPLEMIFKKPLISAPKRLQTMLLKLQKYDLTVNYKKGSEMHLADTLSRSPILESKEQESDNNQTRLDIEHVHASEYVSMSQSGQDNIRELTTKDDQLQSLKQVIINGWPNTKQQVPLTVSEFWNYRDELAEQNGILYKGDRIIIPKALRKEMLTRIHASHQGEQACMRKAREALFWPGMNQQIKETVSMCSTCAELAPTQAREPLIIPEIPLRPWCIVAQDLFELNGVPHLVTVDAFSGFWEVDALKNTTSKSVILKTKKHFARYGIPEEVHTDGGPQFTSSEYSAFSSTWEFSHVVSSPYHAQGNGLVEAAVKAAKSILKKAKHTGRDLWLSVLEYRNTPTEGMEYSPAQRLMARRTRTLVPIKKELLNQDIPKEVPKKLLSKRLKAKKHFDRGTKELPELQTNQPVRVQEMPKHKNGIWKKGSCVQEVVPRSWIVDVDGVLYRRNRRFIRPVQEKGQVRPITTVTTNVTSDALKNTDIMTNTSTDSTKVAQAKVTYKTKFGRDINPPSRLGF